MDYKELINSQKKVISMMMESAKENCITLLKDNGCTNKYAAFDVDAVFNPIILPDILVNLGNGTITSVCVNKIWLEDDTIKAEVCDYNNTEGEVYVCLNAEPNVNWLDVLDIVSRCAGEPKKEKTEQTYNIVFVGKSRFEYQVTAKDEHTALEIAKKRHLHSEENDSILISESITTDTANVFDGNGKEVLNSSLV